MRFATYLWAMTPTTRLNVSSTHSLTHSRGSIPPLAMISSILSGSVPSPPLGASSHSIHWLGTACDRAWKAIPWMGSCRYIANTVSSISLSFPFLLLNSLASPIPSGSSDPEKSAMMAAEQFSGAPLFSGTAFMPSQSTDSSISPSKIRNPQTLIPMTVKQIIEAYHSSEDKSVILVDGAELSNVKLVGLVMNSVERATDVSFTLDDGTGRIDISRWANEGSDANEVASIQNGIYVKVHSHMRGFQGKRHALAFSVQPLTDFNDVVLHFVECIHVHLGHIRVKGGAARMQMNVKVITPFSNGINGYSAPISNQFQAHSSMDGLGNDIYNLVLRLFHEPVMLARENGVHVEELFRRISLPKKKIMEAINYLADVGHIYSTVDEFHFKSANT